MNNLIKYFAIIFLLQIFCISLGQTPGTLEIKNGLYYGESKYIMQTNTYFIDVNDSVAYLEEFYPFKGATFKRLDIILKKDNINDEIYSNNKFVLFIDKKRIILKCINENCKTGPGNSMKMKIVSMKYAPEKIKELNVLNNKAYITHDYFVKMKKYFGEGDRDSCEKKYENLTYQYNVYNLSEQLSHPDFVVEFEKIKVKILNDIKECQKGLEVPEE